MIGTKRQPEGKTTRANRITTGFLVILTLATINASATELRGAPLADAKLLSNDELDLANAFRDETSRFVTCLSWLSTR